MRRRISGRRWQRRRFRRSRTPLTPPLPAAAGAVGRVGGTAAATSAAVSGVAEVETAGNIGGEERGLILAGGTTHLLKGEKMRPKSGLALFRLGTWGDEGMLMEYFRGEKSKI